MWGESWRIGKGRRNVCGVTTHQGGENARTSGVSLVAAGDARAGQGSRLKAGCSQDWLPHKGVSETRSHECERCTQECVRHVG